MKAVKGLVAFGLLFVVVVVYADMPKGKHLEGKDSKVGGFLAHGQGLDPDSYVGASA